MTIALLFLFAGPGPVPDTIPRPPGVEYHIEARLDESSDLLTGRARVKYVNRSASSIDTLWFHQHLNAFRPNSAWARRDLMFGESRFQELGPDEYAFERLQAVRVGDRDARPVYPGSPDSTVVAIPLPSRLGPGDSTVVTLDWTARLSTQPRRQGRRGRHYDWAHWYPRIAVFEDGKWQTQPLLPQGEFYGEFASYDVTLDLAADQVIGATGVPVEGDPGWRANAPIRYARDAYPTTAAAPLGLLIDAPADGRKRVRWRAERVHHFAWSANPSFVFEQGSVPRLGGAGGSIPIRVLYLPGDTSWDEGVALRRTERALTWLQELWGPYLWPQFTNLHRLEGGGTEFPMLVMNGSASEGLILHEAGHQYVHGMLANNEWREGWLDEGVQSFIDDWAQEQAGARDPWASSRRAVLRLEAAGGGEPIATPGADFSDPTAYSILTYTRTSVVLRMLKELVGDETMKGILREYFRRHALSHVTEADLREAVRDVSGTDFDWFFQQWFHTTDWLDYAVLAAEKARLTNGSWRTRVMVRRTGRAWMPVTVQVAGERKVLSGREEDQVVEFVTAAAPTEAIVDPESVLLDRNPANNRMRIP